MHKKQSIITTAPVVHLMIGVDTVGHGMTWVVLNSEYFSILDNWSNCSRGSYYIIFSRGKINWLNCKSRIELRVVDDRLGSSNRDGSWESTSSVEDLTLASLSRDLLSSSLFNRGIGSSLSSFSNFLKSSRGLSLGLSSFNWEFLNRSLSVSLSSSLGNSSCNSCLVFSYQTEVFSSCSLHFISVHHLFQIKDWCFQIKDRSLQISNWALWGNTIKGW